MAFSFNAFVLKPEIVISEVFYDGAEERFEGDEFIEILNAGGASVDISGYRINAGNNGQDFTFPKGTTLEVAKRFRVYTNWIDESTGGFSFGSKRAILNNKGDVACIYDASNTLVDKFAYGIEEKKRSEERSERKRKRREGRVSKRVQKRTLKSRFVTPSSRHGGRPHLRSGLATERNFGFEYRGALQNSSMATISAVDRPESEGFLERLQGSVMSLAKGEDRRKAAITAIVAQVSAFTKAAFNSRREINKGDYVLLRDNLPTGALNYRESIWVVEDIKYQKVNYTLTVKAKYILRELNVLKKTVKDRHEFDVYKKTYSAKNPKNEKNPIVKLNDQLKQHPAILKYREIFYQNPDRTKLADEMSDRKKLQWGNSNNEERVNKWGMVSPKWNTKQFLGINILTSLSRPNFKKKTLANMEKYVKYCRTENSTLWWKCMMRSDKVLGREGLMGKGYVSLEDINKFFIKPQTKGLGAGIALNMINPSDPERLKKSQTQVMISHVWREDILQVIHMLNSMIGKPIKKGDGTEAFTKDTVVWFCAFALYQPGDQGDLPTEAQQLQVKPFQQVVSRVENMAVMQTSVCDPYSKLWCVSELYYALQLKNQKKMQLHPLFSSEWVFKYVKDVNVSMIKTWVNITEGKDENKKTRWVLMKTLTRDHDRRPEMVTRKKTFRNFDDPSYFGGEGAKRYYLMDKDETVKDKGRVHPVLRFNVELVSSLFQSLLADVLNSRSRVSSTSSLVTFRV
jgi:hypothetical protein